MSRIVYYVASSCWPTTYIDIHTSPTHVDGHWASRCTYTIATEKRANSRDTQVYISASSCPCVPTADLFTLYLFSFFFLKLGSSTGLVTSRRAGVNQCDRPRGRIFRSVADPLVPSHATTIASRYQRFRCWQMNGYPFTANAVGSSRPM